MKVFVSWSGDSSKKFAMSLKKWLEQCIQSVEVFFSSDDIQKGENWNSKISSELMESDYGIVCLTPDNVDSPWIHFEAGALSKKMESKVMVMALNMNFSDIKGPLKSFQATKLEEEDVYKLLQSINNAQEKPLSDAKLKNSFMAFWPMFKSEVEKINSETIKKSEEKDKLPKINIGDAIDEILQLVRNQNSLISNPERFLPVDYINFAIGQKTLGVGETDFIFEEMYSFSKYVLLDDKFSSQESNDFSSNYETLIRRITRDNPKWRRRFRNLFMEANENTLLSK